MIFHKRTDWMFAYLVGVPKANTPGTAGGPSGRDRTLAVKSQKTLENLFSFLKKILQGLRVAQAAVTERWP